MSPGHTPARGRVVLAREIQHFIDSSFRELSDDLLETLMRLARVVVSRTPPIPPEREWSKSAISSLAHVFIVEDLARLGKIQWVLDEGTDEIGVRNRLEFLLRRRLITERRHTPRGAVAMKVRSVLRTAGGDQPTFVSVTSMSSSRTSSSVWSLPRFAQKPVVSGSAVLLARVPCARMSPTGRIGSGVLAKVLEAILENARGPMRQTALVDLVMRHFRISSDELASEPAQTVEAYEALEETTEQCDLDDGPDPLIVRRTAESVVARLGPRRQTVLRLRIQEGLTLDRIGARLGISTSLAQIELRKAGTIVKECACEAKLPHEDVAREMFRILSGPASDTGNERN